MMHEQDHLLQIVLQGNRAAITFFTTLARASQWMDDTIDCDKPVSEEKLKQLYWDLLITLPANPFFREHQDTLHPVMAQVLLDWYAANELELEESEHAKQIAFITRNNLVQVLQQCALCIGGYGWAMAHAKAMRLYVHDETYQQFLEAL